MEKTNYINELSSLYKLPKNEVVLVDVPLMNYLAIDGTGDPNNNPLYSESVGALYAVAYKLKFMIKQSPMAIDFKVMPLEGLWWADDMHSFNLEDRTSWQWRMMIMQPSMITQELFASAFELVKKKKNPPMLDQVKFDTYDEGLCMQIFHQGPYGEGERKSVAKLHQQIDDDGYQLNGKHHEIYFNSPLRTSSENLKTIIRQPIKKIKNAKK